MSCRKQIFSAGDEGYALQSVIRHNGKMIARREVFAGEHDIGQQLGFRLLNAGFSIWAAAAFLKLELVRSEQRQRLRAVEPNGIPRSRSDAPCALLLR